MDSTDSTSSTGIGCGAAEPPSALWKPRKPPRVITRAPSSSPRLVYWRNTSKRRARVACCSRNTVSGSNRCGSPSRRHWYSPPTSSRRWVGPAPAGGEGVGGRAGARPAAVRRGGAGVPLGRLVRHHVQADATELAGGAGEELVDQLLGEA